MPQLATSSRLTNVLNQMTKRASVMNVVPGTESYGMKLMAFITPFSPTIKAAHSLEAMGCPPYG
jgi:hypothetical protein